MNSLRPPAAAALGGILLASLWPALPAAASPAPVRQPEAEVVAEVRVQGNRRMSEAEILRLAGIEPGDRIAPETLEAAAGRLRSSGRFDSVEVRRLYGSLDGRGEVVLVISVVEPASTRPPSPRDQGSGAPAGEPRRHLFMWPLLKYTDGYGFTYGGRFTAADELGERTRLSLPVTGGAVQRAAFELERRLDNTFLHTVSGGLAASRTENPHFRVADRRAAVRLGADRRFGDAMRVTAEAEWSDIRFGEVESRATRWRAGFERDTRQEFGFPRDAMVFRAGWEWLDSGSGAARVSIPRLEALRFFGSRRAVLAVAAHYQGASGPLPLWAKPLLGGAGSERLGLLTGRVEAPLRGHPAGARAGDRLAAASAELRIALGPPNAVGGFGLRAFFDTGAVWDVGDSIHDAGFSRGAGAGVFVNTGPFVLHLDGARDFQGGGRWHFGMRLGS